MPERFSARVRRDLRSALLVAARELLVAHGFRGVRMADVAARVGVSRQTVYNEFGDKLGLAQALVLDQTATLLDGIDTALNAHDDAPTAVRAAVTFVLQTCADDPVTKVSLTGEGAEQLLPLLTTRGEPMLVAARERVAEHLSSQWAGLTTDRAELAAETAVRLVVSHLMLPLDPVDLAADKVTQAVTALLEGGLPS